VERKIRSQDRKGKKTSLLTREKKRSVPQDRTNLALFVCNSLLSSSDITYQKKEKKGGSSNTYNSCIFRLYMSAEYRRLATSNITDLRGRADGGGRLLKRHKRGFKIFISIAQHPLIDQSLLIIGASRSHYDTSQSLGLLWTSDQSDAETST
jgi:hypothetical protein